jgi:hypothetical protein
MKTPHHEIRSSDPGTEPHLDPFLETGKQADWRHRSLREHLWGPAGSVGIHLLIILLVLRYFTGTGSQEVRTTPSFSYGLKPPPELETAPPELETTPDYPVPAMPSMTLTRPEALPELARIDPPQGGPVVLPVLEGMAASSFLPAAYSFRQAEAQTTLLHANAPILIQREIRDSVQRALDWLKERQLEDGSWSGEGGANSKTAMTSLALLTYLAHGENQNSADYGETVRRAIQFLIDRDAQEDGTFRHADASQYAQGIAAYALAEAYGLTRIHRIKPVMERALQRILEGQQATGAFNYGLLAGDGRRDTSVAGWMIQAMKAAWVARAEVARLPEAMRQAIIGIKANYTDQENPFAYAPGGDPEPETETGSPSVTPIAVLSLQILGHGKDPEARNGLDRMTDWEPAWGVGHPSAWPLYTWYYATQALFHERGGKWDRWNETFSRMLVRNQNADGSWTPNGITESTYGPVYGTCFSALTLMVYFRYLPSYHTLDVQGLPEETRPDDFEITWVRGVR